MILAVFLILTCTVSLILHGTMDVTVHNRSSIIESVSPVYFCDDGTYNEYSVNGMNAGDIMKIGFRFGLDKLPGGILMCEVKRKWSTESDHQSSTDITITETIEDTLKMMRLLVVWKVNNLWLPEVRIVLIVHDNELVLDEDKLAQLYNQIDDRFFEHYEASESTWSVCDDTVLGITYEIVQQIDTELKITISEGAKMKIPNWLFGLIQKGKCHL
jgi:hypothetical protein